MPAGCFGNGVTRDSRQHRDSPTATSVPHRQRGKCAQGSTFYRPRGAATWGLLRATAKIPAAAGRGNAHSTAKPGGTTVATTRSMAPRPDTSVVYMGLQLRHPFIAGASPLSAKLD